MIITGENECFQYYDPFRINHCINTEKCGDIWVGYRKRKYFTPENCNMNIQFHWEANLMIFDHHACFSQSYAALMVI